MEWTKRTSGNLPRLRGSHNRTTGSTEPVRSSPLVGHVATHVNDLVDDKELVCPEKRKFFSPTLFQIIVTLLRIFFKTGSGENVMSKIYLIEVTKAIVNCEVKDKKERNNR